ncbi:uncharacterized protein [Temnothorax nylanderi]|uniref:uncharacterized protein n=1 Tax=Temnothorax nylanderi TaxID=102681 RepID=UPI003A899F08
MAACSSSSSSRIELLSKENYDTWSMHVEALLTKNDLWEYVSGANVMPAEGIGDRAAAANALRDAWLRQDRKAKADLILSIQPSELKQIRGCETSRDVWLKLESIYASKGPARKATLLKQLMLQRLKDGGDVRDHIAKFFDAVDKLENMKVPINGDLLAIMLLYSLPSSYENFRCAIESRDELSSAEVLKVKIIEESEARKQASGSVVTALAARNVSHTVTSVNGAFCAKTRATNRAWLLDSGCTAHLCGDEELFESIDESSKAKLNLASQASAEVKGKGVVRVSVASDSGHRLIEFKDTLGDLYFVRENLECAKAVVQPACSELLKWHDKLGHLNSKDLVKLVRDGVVPAIDVKDIEQLSRTRWCEVYFLRQKCGVFDAFKLYQRLVEKQTGKKIKSLQSDNGRES